MAFLKRKIGRPMAGVMSTEDRRTRAHLDIPLLLITYTLALFGVYSIAIATFNPDKGTELSVLNYILNSNSASWQAVFCLVSPLILGFLVAVPYELLRVQGRLVYYAIIGLLVLALASEAISGVSAWIPIGRGRTIQPAEFIKIGIILMLARSLSSTEKPFNTFSNAMHNLIIFGAPVLITLAQGEVGSVLVMCVIFYVMLYFADAEPWLLLTIMILAILAVFGLFGYMMVSGSQSFRLQRILSFLNPEEYKNSGGYQILNSQLAIGSGGRTGIGTFVTGSLSQLNYVPEDWTDFIFSAIGEAFGFVGCVGVIFAYFLLLLRMFYLAHYTADKYGRLIIYGVMAMFFAHIVENIGMTVGLLPITGIPLPLISYGGSNFVTNMAGIGLILNVVKNRSSATAINIPVRLSASGRKRRRGKKKTPAIQ
ncbi:MAG: FtsW/RodA/SpoVE family cell cycle protein [Clostridia bacterium]|nr:FtsW/RodA/SpoVE family cell cycle protein [Clostridia bacterium]